MKNWGHQSSFRLFLIASPPVILALHIMYRDGYAFLSDFGYYFHKIARLSFCIHLKSIVNNMLWCPFPLSEASDKILYQVVLIITEIVLISQNDKAPLV